MTTWTTEDREEAYKRLSDKIVKQVEQAAMTPTVIVDSGASYIEPIPFAGMVEIKGEQ